MLGRFLDVLAFNPLARGLLPVLEPGANLIEIACLNQLVPQMFGPRERAVESFGRRPAGIGGGGDRPSASSRPV